ncbi:ADP-ribosylation factor-like protein 4A [Armadillidium nasatum]|uniref:ADP-ribosylation factor-like protein 4A n=1 Tax=Armadillidium nasatum TaxID=96803 RepID=A0A5N5TPQ5_9CRUS|nr:ADP-ribosylation factor-like protein 4A [Armadillidium nasatum]
MIGVWGGGFRWSAWDVGGGEKLRPLWVMYARATDGIVFVVDASSNNDLIEEARVELSRVIKASKLSSQSLNTSPPPVLVLANFQDKSYARGPEEVAIVLGLSEQWAAGIMWAVAPVCGLTGEGLDSALHTLRTLIDGSKKERKKVERHTQKKNPPRWRW